MQPRRDIGLAEAATPTPIPVSRPPSYTAPPPRSGLHLRMWLVNLLFAEVPPFVGARLRTLAMRAAGVQIGPSSAFWGPTTLIGSGDYPARLRVGEHCGFNEGCVFDLEDEVRIGNHVSVGHQVMFLTSNFETGGPARRAGNLTRAPIVIEDGAWLGARATILAGVTVGAGSVIGAGVTVTKSVPPDTLVSGAHRVSIAKWR